MPESRFIYYLRPFSVTNALPAVYPALYYGMCLLSVLPLLGWLLLRRGKRVGKPLIVVPYVTAWVVISTFTFLHCVYALRAYSFPQVYATLLEAVSFLPFGFGVPILLHLWQQK